MVTDMRTAMRILLIRHYRTVNNETRRIMGWGDAPRAENWEEDLLAVDAVLREKAPRIDALYSSALGRARETMRYFADRRGCSSAQVSPGLNEVNYGELFQRPKQWVAEKYPEYKTDADFVFPGGESFRQMQGRSVDFVLSLQHNHAGENLLLVAHAGVIRGLVCHFLGLDLTANLTRKISHRYIGDFVIDRDACVFYDEIGKPSGFVKDGVIEVPCGSRPAASPPLAAEAMAAFPKRDSSHQALSPAVPAELK
jgi:broad specificity phosphatase PhoE